jgi:hypothetical protein
MSYALGQLGLEHVVLERGVTSFPGIYFLGIRWLYKRKSHFMLKAGPAEDAAYIAEHIKTRGKPN